MIRLWLSRETAISVREQLSAQLVLAIVSGRLTPGERLPSVRDLARRIKVHANTVSSVYRDLAQRGWVTQKRGSGVFVRALSIPRQYDGVEAFVRSFLEEGRAHGYTIEAIESALALVVREPSKPSRLRVVHPDIELARVLAAEVAEAVEQPVEWATFEDARVDSDVCFLVTSPHERRMVDELNPVHSRVITLRSIEEVIAGHPAPSGPVVIAVVSRSPSLLQWCSMLLPTLGVHATDVIQRNPAKSGWQAGLKACGIVAADVVSCRELPRGVKPTIFRIVSAGFLAEFRSGVTRA